MLTLEVCFQLLLGLGFLAFWTVDQEPQAVGLVEDQVGGGDAFFAAGRKKMGLFHSRKHGACSHMGQLDEIV